MFSATSWFVAVICRMLEELSSVLEERASTRSLIACNEIAIDFKARAVSSTATICSPRPLEERLHVLADDVLDLFDLAVDRSNLGVDFLDLDRRG